ncbi:MAG: hypothetical protein ACRC18_07095 [Cetobacterium sp.]
MKKKQTSIKLNEYFKIVKPEYIYYKLTPTTFTRNHKTDKFEDMINKLCMDTSKKFEFHNKSLIVNTDAKISYYIFMEKGGDTSFYFIIPEFYKNQFKDKISNNWNGVAMNEVSKSEVPQFSENCIKYALSYTKEDGLSLEANKSDNHLIDANINVLDVLEEGDKVGIFYNFQPMGWYQQKTFSTKYHETLSKIDKMKPVDKNKGDYRYIIKSVLQIMYQIVDGVLNPVGRKSTSEFNSTELALLRVLGKTYSEVSNSTKRKESSKVVRTQILVISEAKDIKRQRNNAEAICNSFAAISGDNSLKPKKVKDSKFDTDDMEKFNVVETKNTSIMSDLEISNHISLPSKDKLREKNIECISITEKVVPDELREGDIFIGNAPIKGEEMSAHLSSDDQIGNLPLVIEGGQNAGKSTLTENLVVMANRAKKKEANVVFDFIKECELSENISRNIPIEDQIILDLTTLEGLQGFGFNEVEYKDNMTGLELMKIANKQTQQIISLVDAINDCGEPLSPRMRRFLSAACFLAFIHPNQALSNVIAILEEFEVRHEYINNVHESVHGFMKSKISALKELDDKDKNGCIKGTNGSKIEHILDRISLLRDDFMLETMFNKPISDNLNFKTAIDQGKTIFIKMPESEYSTEYVKNVIVTFFMSKVWLASQIRKVDKDSTRVNVIVDEIFQAPTCMRMLKRILPQCRKFKLRMILSIHYINQVKEIAEPLKAAGCSFMLLQGTEKANFKALENEFNNLGYDMETLLNLKQYQSLNLVKIKNGYAAFVTQLPKPVKNKIELQNVIEVDFSHLDKAN